jgi:hypothetical protein
MGVVWGCVVCTVHYDYDYKQLEKADKNEKVANLIKGFYSRFNNQLRQRVKVQRF